MQPITLLHVGTLVSGIFFFIVFLILLSYWLPPIRTKLHPKLSGQFSINDVEQDHFAFPIHLEGLGFIPSVYCAFQFAASTDIALLVSVITYVAVFSLFSRSVDGPKEKTVGAHIQLINWACIASLPLLSPSLCQFVSFARIKAPLVVSLPFLFLTMALLGFPG